MLQEHGSAGERGNCRDEGSAKVMPAMSSSGVYAQKKRMPKHHVAVAISMNPEDTSARPRGLTIYPKNPSRGKPQQAISIYSDLCDTMGYPLLFPDAQGGYALHKYPRRTAKDPKPSYEQNIRNHIEELLSNEENPEDYYKLGTRVQ
ncbi:hypothetical protein GCK72_012352 [Caenorhabditis remanei]|uniref:Uncharacterized protein n=1 Tax=Caenorhabditis remanei TaxID=31234 RepID=A0A6A5GNE2_CAERE|nr:hypothetical protein GCK72_012352 [Caenorhabditis remanei]KAF1755899.1 hypothetical protein GCK72_012352 [Caenorhabditis remanei]